MRRRANAGPKRILRQSIIAEQGINLIYKRLLSMGFLWYPSGGVEAGIDGHIELRDSQSGEVFNAIIQVQSKATKESLGNGNTFEFVCEQRDIDYWMKGNAPVILVRSRPDSDEAYWKSIKVYFADPKRRQVGKVVFDKNADRFDDSAREKLRELAIPAEHGVYFAPPPTAERLLSNLLPVQSFPTHIYVAETPYGTTKALFDYVRLKGLKLSGECIVRDKRLYSFHDLREQPWSQFCDRGTVDPIPSADWANSSDEQKQYEFSELLGRSLTALLHRLPIRRFNERKYYYFLRTKHLTPRTWGYKSLKRGATKTVFQGYPSKKDPSRIAYYRHTAFESAFRRYGGNWYVEIVPTYHFTTDGTEPHPNYESKLKGIKAQERNNAVRNLVLMWASILGDKPGGLLPADDLLQFGDSLLDFEIAAGLPDAEWAPMDESASGTSDAGLFGLVVDED